MYFAIASQATLFNFLYNVVLYTIKMNIGEINLEELKKLYFQLCERWNFSRFYGDTLRFYVRSNQT